MKKNADNKVKTKNTKSNIVFALIFGGLVLGLAGNCLINEKMQDSDKQRQVKLSSNFEFISANVVSNVDVKTNKNKVSYFVDLDFNNDGKADKTVALIDDVKYVSSKRLSKISKIKQGTKLVFECNVESHVDIDINGEYLWPKIIVDSISGSSAVGLIDHVIVVDGEIIGDARKNVNREYIDFLDEIAKDSFGFVEDTKIKDKKIDDKSFKYFYVSNLRAR